MTKHRNQLDRFLTKILINKRTDCFEWIGATIKGYGTFDHMYAHRYVYELYKGDFNKNLHVLHKCDNPGCVRIDHLFLGTVKDNMKDRDQKGRFKRLCGEKNGNSKISNKQVLEIKGFYKKGLSQTNIAKLYNVTQASISYVINQR